MSNEPAIPENDEVFLIEEADDTGSDTALAKRPWRVLVVDDEPDVHQATSLALRDVMIFGRPIDFLRAESAAAARALIGELGDVAVALVDVVMEKPDSGLTLVRDLRAAGLDNMRIILRTGHPGYAPEQSVINDYEIDDYRTKGELTRTRLLTVLTAAIRSYDHLCAIERGRAGLELIVESSSKLFKRTNLELFSRGVLTQMAGLLDVSADGMVCVYRLDSGTIGESEIVSASGRFSPFIGKRIREIPDPDIRAQVEAAPFQGGPVVRDGYMSLHFKTDIGRGLIVLLENIFEIEEQDLALLKLFSTNIAIGFENLSLVEMLDELAYLDPSLKIPNLNGFEQKLHDLFDAGGRRGYVAVANLESFQSIGATHGLPFALRFMAQVCDDLTEGEAIVARVGDATLAILCNADAFDRSELHRKLTCPRQIDGYSITMMATCTIVDLGEIEPDPAVVMGVARSALLYLRHTQRGVCRHYDHEVRAAVERRTMLQTALHGIAASGEGLAVHLQPKVALSSGEVTGAEALLRWTLEGAPVSPAEFIPIAEAGGMIKALTGFVIRQVGEWARARKEHKPLPVAVNLSVAELNQADAAKHILKAVSDAGLGPETIEFEVTEGIGVGTRALAQEQILALSGAGFRISLDDFGTGYSSLSQFDRLPIDMIKIDRSFVSGLNASTARMSLAAVVLGMTQNLNVDCVAEGIETEEQKQALIFLGCKTGQGFLLGRPTPIEDFDAAFVSG